MDQNTQSLDGGSGFLLPNNVEKKVTQKPQLLNAIEFIERHKYRIYDFDTGEPGVHNWIVYHPGETDTAELLGGFFDCRVVSVFHIDGEDYICPNEVSYDDEENKIGYLILTY